jgi:hypothetical protein
LWNRLSPPDRGGTKARSGRAVECLRPALWRMHAGRSTCVQSPAAKPRRTQHAAPIPASTSTALAGWTLAVHAAIVRSPASLVPCVRSFAHFRTRAVVVAPSMPVAGGLARPRSALSADLPCQSGAGCAYPPSCGRPSQRQAVPASPTRWMPAPLEEIPGPVPSQAPRNESDPRGTSIPPRVDDAPRAS